MGLIEVGRVCVKRKGKEAGRKVVVVELKEGFAVIEGIGVKRKKCNVMHLFPTEKKVELKKGASREEIAKALEW